MTFSLFLAKTNSGSVYRPIESSDTRTYLFYNKGTAAAVVSGSVRLRLRLCLFLSVVNFDGPLQKEIDWAFSLQNKIDWA